MQVEEMETVEDVEGKGGVGSGMRSGHQAHAKKLDPGEGAASSSVASTGFDIENMNAVEINHREVLNNAMG